MVILIEFIRPNALECEGPKTLLRRLATVANGALRSPWIKIVLRGFSCGGENRTPDMCVDEWTTSLHR
eukprot:scaffold23960_cov42-Attheya_sp.AAC.3